MKPTKRSPQKRRCSECRRWFTPAASAAKTQMTCCKACRLRRRAKQEKRRRDADFLLARQADRERQRAHRCREKEKKGVESRVVSQAGPYLKLIDIIKKIVAKMRQAEHRSQAGLRCELRDLAQLARVEYERLKLETGTRNGVSQAGLIAGEPVAVG